MSTIALFASFFLRQPAVLVAFAVAWVVGAIFLVRKFHRRSRSRVIAAIAAAASVALIIAFTWLPGSGDPAELLQTPCDFSRVPEELLDPHAAIGAWAYGTDGPLNVLLYIPAGLTLTLLPHRIQEVWKVLLGLAALSLATEIWQALTGTRSGSLSDVSTNTIGALIGAMSTTALRLALYPFRRRRLADTATAE